MSSLFGMDGGGVGGGGAGVVVVGGGGLCVDVEKKCLKT